MSNQILVTARFFLREFETTDAEALFRLNSDPEVLHYTGDVPFQSIDAARAFVEGYAAYKKYGMGRWAVVDKTTKEFIGWCGLNYRVGPKKHDLGFRFFRTHWDKGIATETGRACLEYGFTILKLQKITAHARIENLASIRVLEKLGMRFEGKSKDHEHVLVNYASTSLQNEHK